MAPNLRADCRTIASSPAQAQLQPVAPRTFPRAAVPPQLDRRIQCGDGRINAPVAIKIRKDHTAMQSGPCKLRPQAIGHILKTPTLVQEDTIRLGILRVQTSSRNKQVDPAIAVKVH